jgi:hypothetical protein
MSLILSGTDGLSDVDGSAATPAIRGTDANTGIFFGSDIIGFSEGGVEAARINADSQFVAAAGTAALPVITTTGDTNTGIFFPAADTIAFAEGGTEAMRIDSSGNVGIGTSSPTQLLTLSNGATPRLSIKDTRASVDMQMLADNTAGYSGTVTNYPYIFVTNNAERARIDSSGNLLVTTTSQINPGSGTQAGINLNAIGQIVGSVNSDTNYFRRTGTDGNLMVFYKVNSAVGGISVTASATAYATSSDYRLKENIMPMTGGLAKVSALKPVIYTWKSNQSDGQGFIAHELAEVVPQCVIGEKDAVDADGNPQYQGIDTSFLVATLTAAIQEQQALITQLTTRITALETK